MIFSRSSFALSASECFLIDDLEIASAWQARVGHEAGIPERVIGEHEDVVRLDAAAPERARDVHLGPEVLDRPEDGGPPVRAPHPAEIEPHRLPDLLVASAGAPEVERGDVLEEHGVALTVRQ